MSQLISRVLLAATLLTTAAAAQSLPATLAKLDAASARFKSAQATFHNEDYTALVKDTTTQDGTLYSVRKGPAVEMGIRATGPGARTVEYKNGQLKDYNPGINCYNAVDASRNKSTVDTFLTLAFGTSGKELAAAWNIKDLGPEAISGVPRPVEKLDLTPKDPGMSNNVKHITLWMDLDRGVSVKLIFYAPTGDTHTATYTNIVLNEKVNTTPYEIKAKPCGK